ncbi:MAG: flagellar motor protein MotB [Treponema sp.]|jgi:chemotaxis protein MotB|nr:flagellar motor protein MotB [Treponema sp.]
MARKKKEDEGVKGDWIVTYSDMVTLLLCFFVMLFNPDDVDPGELASFLSALNNTGLGGQTGGNTLSVGKSADLGNTINSLPSTDRGRSLGAALRKATSIFNPEMKSNKVKITQEERGIVISLASDAFFDTASATLNIEQTREILFNLASTLNSPEISGRKFRIEGHTDAEATDPFGPWPSNWELSTARAIAVLHFLMDLGVDEKRFQVAGFADTVPVGDNSTAEGRAYNRRVDVIILDDAHL